LIEKFIEIGRFYQVYENIFLIFEKVRIIRYTFFAHRPQAFKELSVIVIYAYPENIRGYFNSGHLSAPPFFGYTGQLSYVLL